MSRQKGFTLIEVLVALMIVAAAIIAAASMWSGNFMRIRKSALQYDVATLLERKMVEIEAKYTGKPLTEIPEEDAGDFGSDYPQYKWTLKSRELKFPDLTSVLTGREEAPDEMLITMMKQVTEYIGQAVKEVKVSVFVTRKGGKELEFAASQYFVDYTKEFQGAAAAGAAAGGGGGGNPTPAPAGGGGGAGGGGE